MLQKPQFDYRRWLLAICLIVGGSGVPTIAQTSNGRTEAPEFPYRATVIHDNAPVRSGPGSTHYATDQLPQGATVEVYRHDPGGWCAIRPPENSFSLIPERAVQLLDEDIVQITQAGTQAWVGTGLGQVDQPLWQVKLKKGEQVEILGQVEWPDPEGRPTIWYQIAPPAGEFRWILASDIQSPFSGRHTTAQAAPSEMPPRNPPVRSVQSTIQSTTVQPATYAAPIAEVSEEHPGPQQTSSPIRQPRLPEPPPSNAGWRQARHPIDRNRFSEPSTPSTPSPIHTASPRSIIATGVAELTAPGRSSASTSPPPRFASTHVDPRFDLQQIGPQSQRPFSDPSSSLSVPPTPRRMPLSPRLAEIELRLSNEMIKAPQQWRLIDLETRARSIYESTTDPLERLHAQQLLKKLEDCKKLRAGYQQISTGSPTASSSDQPVGAGVSGMDQIQLDTVYDASGWLNELVRDGGMARSVYVLQDDTGKITHQITPTPGLNLHRYLKKKVGIIGKRGYNTELKLDHVTADRIIDLSRR